MSQDDNIYNRNGLFIQKRSKYAENAKRIKMNNISDADFRPAKHYFMLLYKAHARHLGHLQTTSSYYVVNRPLKRPQAASFWQKMATHEAVNCSILNTLTTPRAAHERPP